MQHHREVWIESIRAATTEVSLREIESNLLGRNGAVTEMVKAVATLPREQRAEAGKTANQLKVALEAEIQSRRATLADAALAAELLAEDFDPSEPGMKIAAAGNGAPGTSPGTGSGGGIARQRLARHRGTLHPISIVRNELVDLFTSMGFTWQDGPEIETDWFNFEALNIPGDHPARDTQDTFWLDDGNLLRTHTSPVQIRSMLRMEPPLKVIVPGRCFRAETVDASHEHTFYQMEGLVVDEGVSTANLIHAMKTCLRVVLRREVKVRLRPGFFPFVEPGFELDVNCPFCGGSGCSVCKHSGWIEILPCGMVHPRVLEAGGIDPERYTGFAFGMGLQRVVMLRYGIDDIRLFTGGDLRFLEQFGEVRR